MGRIAPRRSKTRWDPRRLWQSGLHWWRQRPWQFSIIDETPACRSSAAIRRKPYARISPLLRQLWHLPDGFQWMEPLPYPHRRWLLIAAALLLIVLLWPYSPTPQPTRVANPTNVPLTSEPAPVQARLVNPSPRTDSVPATEQPEAPPAAAEKPWQNYQIASGQTLAQLFRDHNLPVNDVFAMAQVEGSGKPLSSLHAGQKVRLRLNAQDVVSELEIDTMDNQTVQFVRQQDGTFVRTR
ncbi:Opacity-associated protein A [Lonsdalea populi]|uniref:Opacity-associated protein A n=2 Tax=Lonsdalea populi TaxID=1172565 RepID=A0A3N0UQN0_9GAMM|nr:MULTISPECIES: LysM-like peptidoglycan-binding domain-containing protein [Lonsdalea]OSN01604.1 Opacity-associated protein A [Lonsdalea populi]QPQ24765.1 Opacity-associated protein A [Lonsdalea populi]RAT15227.1 Opacity-associated protein A [Lonsdalea quercina]RAT28979.1 Opacity-associated protein A [Lonsdalea populi]RAT34817.1 Opacity-associated protein A [Lonsdalea populi]